MKTVALIGCTKSKRDQPAPARELYQESDLFCKRLRYAQSLDPDLMLVLSAKHQVLEMDEVVEPYDKTLRDFSREEGREWASKVLSQLKEQADLNRDRFILLASRDYYRDLLPHLAQHEIPTEGMQIGETMSHLESAAQFDGETKAQS